MLRVVKINCFTPAIAFFRLSNQRFVRSASLHNGGHQQFRVKLIVCPFTPAIAFWFLWVSHQGSFHICCHSPDSIILGRLSTAHFAFQQSSLSHRLLLFIGITRRCILCFLICLPLFLQLHNYQTSLLEAYKNR